MTEWHLDDEDDDTQGEKPAGKGGNGLRAHLKKLEEQNRELAEANKRFAAQLRERTITDVIAGKGLDKRIAKFIPADVETSTEAVEKWLGEYGDLFGAKTPAAPEGDDDAGEDDDEMVQLYGRMGKATAGARTPGTKEAAVMARLNDPTLTQEQLLQLIASGGAIG